MIKINSKNFQSSLSVLKLLPNFLTLMALTIGLNSFKMALEARWEKAVLCIIIAAIIDGLDGKLARLLNASSSFGAELDSLCDFVNFGVCPVFVLYLWLCPILPASLLWSSTVIYTICMSIRLARFNTSLLNPTKVSKLFFIGVPAPCGALLVMLPLILTFDILGDLSIDYTNYAIFFPFYIVLIACLLPSRLPTFSLKNVQIKKEYVRIVMVVFGIATLEAILHPWYAIPIICFTYIVSMFFSFAKARKIEQ